MPDISCHDNDDVSLVGYNVVVAITKRFSRHISFIAQDL